ncbi:MAG: hypothetical protein ABH872_06320 [Candidatus Omnitrophota bacterium]
MYNYLFFTCVVVSLCLPALAGKVSTANNLQDLDDYAGRGRDKLKAEISVKKHKVDLDNDGIFEQVTYEQRFDEPVDMLPIPIEAEVAVFDSSGDKIGSFFMPDHVGEVEFVSLNKDGFKQIAARSYGGAHYTNIAVYGYENGNLYEIFANGSACGVETNFDKEIPEIRVGRANWEEEGWSYADEPLWQVYTWTGHEFVVDESLSTTSEISQQEESDRYVDKIKAFIEENKSGR